MLYHVQPWHKVKLCFHMYNLCSHTCTDPDPVRIKAKQPESGDLCGDITEFGVAEGSPEPAG